MVSADALLRVCVVFACAPRQVVSVELTLPSGSTVFDAVRASGLLDGDQPAVVARLAYGVWGQRRPATAHLRDGDRVEITRELVVDPMTARRERQRAQGKPARRR